MSVEICCPCCGYVIKMEVRTEGGGGSGGPAVPHYIKKVEQLDGVDQPPVHLPAQEGSQGSPGAARVGQEARDVARRDAGRGTREKY